ncbi:MAG: hypothetical protein R2911_04920 [Caldilineaceae bacterium]
MTREHFLSFETAATSTKPGFIAGFLRLSLPKRSANGGRVGSRAFLDEIADSAMIRRNSRMGRRWRWAKRAMARPNTAAWALLACWQRRAGSVRP